MARDIQAAAGHGAHIMLSREQLEALTRCAEGLSLRFDQAAVVNALLNAGYVRKNVVGVISITEAGREYLSRRHRPG